jgi:hypothetical protein
VGGAVRDREGRPIEGAGVTARALIDGEWRSRSAETDPAGRWRATFSGTDRARVSAEVVAEGYRSETETGTADPEAKLPITLTAFGAATASVRFTGSRPQFLRAQRKTSGAGLWRPVDLVFEGEGRIRLRRLDPGPCRIRFELRGYHTPPREIRVPEGGMVEMGEIVFPKGGTVRGLVLDEEGRPVAGALYRVEGFEPEDPTRDDGSFVLRHVPPGRRTIRVRDREATREGSAELTFVDGGEHEVEIRISE